MHVRVPHLEMGLCMNLSFCMITRGLAPTNDFFFSIYLWKTMLSLIICSSNFFPACIRAGVVQRRSGVHVSVCLYVCARAHSHPDTCGPCSSGCNGHHIDPCALHEHRVICDAYDAFIVYGFAVHELYLQVHMKCAFTHFVDVSSATLWRKCVTVCVPGNRNTAAVLWDITWKPGCHKLAWPSRPCTTLWISPARAWINEWRPLNARMPAYKAVTHWVKRGSIHPPGSKLRIFLSAFGEWNRVSRCPRGRRGCKDRPLYGGSSGVPCLQTLVCIATNFVRSHIRTPISTHYVYACLCVCMHAYVRWPASVVYRYQG